MHTEKSVILVSGGSKGLGGALVTHLLELGYLVATFSRSSTPLIEDLSNRYSDCGSFMWKAVDGTKFENVKQFTTFVIRRYGKINTLINNAGIGFDGVIATMQITDIQKIISLNLECSIYLMQACSRIMLQQESGNIINISSVNAIRGHAGVSVYSATKAALDGMTRSLARELGPRGIRVNSIAPGYFESDMVHNLTDEQKNRIIRRTPLGRLGNTNDLVNVICFLLSPSAEFITGQTIVVDGGITC